MRVGAVVGVLLALAGAGCAAGCSSGSSSPQGGSGGTSPAASSPAPSPGAPTTGASATPGKVAWKPAVGSRWQYQLSGDRAFAATGGINVGICATPSTGGPCVRPEVFDIDLYADRTVIGSNATLNTAAVKAIHARGGKAICYLDAGSVEKGRPDYRQYVAWDAAHGNSLIGKSYPGFPDENYANINNDRGQRDFVLRMQEARVRKCVRAGFDGVEFDVVNVHEDGAKVTGWDVGASAQLTFNRALAALAHRYGLAAGLKNDLTQVPELVGLFDFAVNEQCWQYRECGRLKPFIQAGKPVFSVEYEAARGASGALGFCREAASPAWNFSTIKKGDDYALFGKPYTPCR